MEEVKMELKPGDLFCSKSSGVIPWMIRAVQWFWSTDNEATFNHSGIILGRNGSTLEAKFRIKKYHLEELVGKQVLIVRHKQMNKIRCLSGLKAVAPMVGKFYPGWRLPLHLFKLAKFFAFGPGVCSEFTGKFMAGAGFKNIVYGITPDDLADRWRIDRDMVIIFEGVLKKEDLP